MEQKHFMTTPYSLTQGVAASIIDALASTETSLLEGGPLPN